MATPLSRLGPTKLFGLLQRRVDISLAAFCEHWRTVHRAEALKLRPFFTAYVQNHRIDEDAPGFFPACDGAPELWFESADNVVAMQTSDAYKTGAYIDEPNFMQGRAVGMMVQDRVIRAGPALMASDDGVRANLFLRRDGGRDADSFAEWMLSDDRPVLSLAGEPMRHVRSLALPTPDGPPVYDAVESYWWPTLEALRRAWGKGALTAHAAPWLDARSCGSLVCREVRIVWPNDGVDFSG